VRIMKEKVSYVALDAHKEDKEFHQRIVSSSSRAAAAADERQRVVEYPLPDGRTIKLGPERFWAPEILFNPELIGLEYPGVHQILVDSIQRTDMDLRKALYGSIVLSGGSTLTRGFGDRLLHEVQRLAVKDMRIKIFAPPERKYTTWTGGSILAGLSTFKKVGKPVLCATEHRLTSCRCGWTRTSGRRIRISSTPSLRESRCVGNCTLHDPWSKAFGRYHTLPSERLRRCLKRRLPANRSRGVAVDASLVEDDLGITNTRATLPSRWLSLSRSSQDMF
jgi:hypothetical protein